MDPVHIQIDRLSLRLPAGFEHRADAIARHVGRELARLPWPGAPEIDWLRPPPVNVHPAQGDRQIAVRIARAIHSQISKSEEG
jgi:hypothetical protein